MPGENCLVCASDEGIFLDVVEQPALLNKAKNCRLRKVSEDGPSTKVCHKCAFEIEQCNYFVEKVRKANKTNNSKRSCCILCSDTYTKDIFFDLSKQKIGISNLTLSIRDLFPDEFKQTELQKQFICLSCRYCVDLLIDLRNLSDEIPTKLKSIIQNGIDPADLPKTRTSIVNRKTTFIQSSNLDLNTPSDTDSDSSIMSNRKKINNKVNKTLIEKSQRKCQQCKTEVKSGIDMYKIYRTGVTVCKQCWLTIDPGKTKTPSKKRKKMDYSETKLCSVLLEDVYKKNPNDREYKIEKDNKGNTLFIVTDDSESENKTKRKTNKTKSNEVENKQDQEDVEMKKAKPVRSGKKKEEVDKSIRSSRKRKESEQSTQEETEIKPLRNRRHRGESEQSTKNEIETKPTRSNRRRMGSEESTQEEDENKLPTNVGKNSEQSTENNMETKTTRSNQRRKQSEESLHEDVEVRSTRSARNRRDSEQSVQENVETRSTRSTRSRKESEQSLQESENKSIRSNKNLRDLEQNSQESIVIISTRGVRRRKDSEQSAQEDIEVNVDVDSDSAPVFKKAKKSSARVESMPKQIQSKTSNQNSAASDVILTGKRGRSSSLESTSSVRRSTRNAKKSPQELEEIIEIDDDSNSFKMQKENVVINEDVSTPESKRNRKDRIISCDEHSDTESNISEIKVGSKRSSSVSSKESIPVSTFKAPPNKDSQEHINLESLKLVSKDLKSNKFIKIRKPEAGKPDDAESLKSIEIDTSESEEIDVLKSTDEETKDVETESEERDNSTILGLKESTFESAVDDDPKSDKEIIEPVDDDVTTSIDVDNSKSTEDNVDFVSLTVKSPKSKNTENENSEVEESTKSNAKGTKKKHRTDFQSIKQDILENSENASIKENDSEKEINVTADFNDTDVNLSEENSNQSAAESIRGEHTSSKRSLLNTSSLRKSKSSSSKKSKKNKSKNSSDDIHDYSDSETTKIIEQTDLTYTCTICDKIYENKFIGLQHELTHMKTLEIKLEKVELPEKNKLLNESEPGLEVSSKEGLQSDEESMIVDSNEVKSENNIENNEEPAVAKENNENEVLIDEEKEKTENESSEQSTKESSIKNEIVDTAQVIKDEEVSCNKLNEIQENTEENRIENGETAIINDSEEEIVECTEIKRENEVETSNRRSTRRLSKKIEPKSDRKSRGKRKITNEVVELEEEVTTIMESDSDKIAEAVQETLNDMAELHGKIQESSPANVPETNKQKTGEQENDCEIEMMETNVENNEVTESVAKEETIVESDVDQRVITKHKEEDSKLDDKLKVENDLKVLIEDVEAETSKQSIFEDSEELKEVSPSAVKVIKIHETEAVTVESMPEIQCEQIDLLQNNKLSKDVIEPEEEVVENARENKSSDVSLIEINSESLTEPEVATTDRPSSEKNDGNLNKNDLEEEEEGEILNEDEDNNTEDEEALAQESLEELLQRKGLQIIDEFAESVTDDGDEESEKDMSSEKENVPDKEVEVDNELQIKISDAECTEILESSKSLAKQKEVEQQQQQQSVVGESQIIQDVDVVEEVINDEDEDDDDDDHHHHHHHHPHGDVVQEVEVESNGNCVNVANNVVGQVLTEVFNMATVDISKRLDLETEPISDEEMIPETLENISREIRNSQDMPSLDPIGEAIDD